MTKRWLVPTLCASGVLSAAVLLVSSGCGLLTAPVSGPAAIAENTSFSLSGSVVDQDGKPLDGVLMTQTLRHHFWTPIQGGADTDEHKLRRTDAKYSVSERGATLALTFTREGYYESAYSLSVADGPVVTTPNGAWIVKGTLPVVMYAKEPRDSDLATYRSTLSCAHYPEMEAVKLDQMTGLEPQRIELDGQPVPKLPPGIFYLTIEKGTLKPRNAAGDVAPVDVNLPARLTLHISGEDGSFVRIEPRLGYAPLQASEEAPASGYVPTLTFDQPRLREMRLARADDIVAAHEYFYFRARGRYGKGSIAWAQTFARGQKEPLPAEFRCTLYQAREPGDRRLITRTASSN